MENVLLSSGAVRAAAALPGCGVGNNDDDGDGDDDRDGDAAAPLVCFGCPTPLQPMALL